MIKPFFNAEDYKDDNTCMHCTTPEQLDAFCEYLDSIGRHWSGGELYTRTNNRGRYGDSTVYYFNSGTYGHIDRAIDKGVLILESNDFEWDKNAPCSYEVDLTFDQLFGENKTTI